MLRTVDLLVVGGGVVGASIAYHAAALHGGSVLLCEQHAPAARGATAKSGGLLRMHHTDRHEARLACLSFGTFVHWGEAVGGDCGFVRTGFAMVVGPEHVRNLRRNVAMLQSLDAPVKLLSPEEFLGLHPDWELNGVGAVAYEPNSGYADAVKTTLGFLAAAGRCGAEVMEGVRITELEVSRGRVTGVVTNAGRISAGAVVVAGNVWARPLLAQVGVGLEVRAKHIGICFLGVGARAAGLCTSIDDTGRTYFRPEAGGRLLVGLSGDVWDLDPDLEPPPLQLHQLEDARRRAARRLPWLRDAPFVGARSGFDGYTPDRHALIGPVGEIERLYVSVGFSGGGFKVAPAVGRAVAQEVLEERCAQELEAYRPERFALGQPIRPEHPYTNL
jgi:glycine/D-amino acid oxidase-like deaminating enzyme